MTLQYKLFLTPESREMLLAITDRRIRQKIQERIDGLATDPDKQGKPLGGELSLYRSIRAVGQRYRIIYRVENKKVIVIILAIGRREEGSKKDIYALAKKLMRTRLIEE